MPSKPPSSGLNWGVFRGVGSCYRSSSTAPVPTLISHLYRPKRDATQLISSNVRDKVKYLFISALHK